MLDGPPDTPYVGGQYHGILKFPSDYPYNPPAIRMFTPSGRFKPGMRLCLSISDYHPKSWNPAWSVSTILTGLMSFMVSDENTAGSITASTETRIEMAKRSRQFNNSQNAQFREIFPELVEENIKTIAQQELDSAANAATGAATPAAAAAPLTQQPAPSSSNMSATPSDTKPSINDTPADRAEADVPANSPNNNNNGDRGMSLSQKVIFVSILFVSWVIASRMFS